MVQDLGSVTNLSIEGNGFTRVNLRQDRVSDFKIYLPPIEEQEQIVSVIDTQIEEIDVIISLEQEKLKLLTEYKKNLVSQLVTGTTKL